MRKLKSDRAPNPYARKILVQSKVNATEMRNILAKAHAWTGGSISELIRRSIKAYQPTKEEFKK